MRTTIELTDDQRAGLLVLAARRGMRGYSLLIQEALSRYLGLSWNAPAAKTRPRKRAGGDIMGFLCDGFSSGRRDGSARHDDHIYRAA